MIKSLSEVTSLNTPGLDLYRTLKRPLSHREQGFFVAEGSTVVERFFAADTITAVSALMTPQWFDHFKSVISGRPEALDIYIGEDALLEEIVSFRLHQGVMAAGRVPYPVSLGEAVGSSVSPRFFVAVEGLTSAENTGVVIRNCAGCGVQVFIRGETSADPWLRRSVRNSMGTIFNLPVAAPEKLTDAILALRQEHGFRVYAAHPRRESAKVFETDFSGNCCVVFGSEGHGLSAQVIEACDRSIAIPMAGGVDSFNVACASAVFLYEAMRQRSGAR